MRVRNFRPKPKRTCAQKSLSFLAAFERDNLNYYFAVRSGGMEIFMLNELSFLNDMVIRDTKEYAGKKLAAKKHELAESVYKSEEAVRDSLESSIEKNTRKIHEETEKEIASLEKEAFKKLILFRDKIKDDIKSELRKRLSDFANSPGYKDYLAEKTEKAKEIAGGDSITASVFREEDAALPGGIKAEVIPSSSAGGVIFRIPGRGIIIDNSFDTAIDMVMDDFNEISLK